MTDKSGNVFKNSTNVSRKLPPLELGGFRITPDIRRVEFPTPPVVKSRNVQLFPIKQKATLTTSALTAPALTKSRFHRQASSYETRLRQILLRN